MALNPMERRRYSTQRSRLFILDSAIAELKRMIDADQHDVLQLEIWRDDLRQLEEERAELWQRFPKATAEQFLAAPGDTEFLYYRD